MRTTKVLMIFLMAACAFAADVAGKWKATMHGPDGEMQMTFNFKVDGDKVTGTVEGPMGSMEIKNGKVDGDKIEFTVETEQFKVVHKGTVSGDEMKLKVQMGDQGGPGPMEMTAKRVKS